MTEEVRSALCGLCIAHCQIGVKVSDGRVVGLEYSKAKGCPRSLASAEFIYHPDRLNYPLKRAGDRGQNQWQRISWEQALDEIADKLSEIRDKYGAEAVTFCAGGDNQMFGEYFCRLTNLFGSPNRISHAQVCYCPGQALTLMASGRSIPPLGMITPDTNCLMLVGFNPSVVLRTFWQDLLEATGRGCKVIVLDPRRTDAAQRADVWLQLRPGTDAALMLGMVNTIIEENLYDKEFVTKYCYGWDELVERAGEYPPERVSEITWVPAEKIKEAARMYAANKAAMIMRGMGIEMSQNSLRAQQLTLILPIITGQINLMGGNLMVEPHTRVRVTGLVEADEKLSPEQKRKQIGYNYATFSWQTLDWLRENMKKITNVHLSHYYFGGMAHAPSVFRAMLTGKPYPVRGMVTVSNNPLLTYPNSKLVYEAIKTLDLHVAMDVFMTPTCQMADYVLPAAASLEKPVVWGGDYWPVVEGGAAVIEPLYERKDEYYFYSQVGRRLGQDWPWETLEDAWDWRLEPLGVNHKQFVSAQSGYGVDMEMPDLESYKTVGFGTPTGKYELSCTILERCGQDPLPHYDEPVHISDPELAKEFPLLLIGHRPSQHHYHSQWHQFPSFKKKEPEPVAQMHPEKAAELGINDGDWMWIESPIGKAKFKCRHFTGIDPRLVSAPHGWWFPEEPGEEPSLHGVWRSNINALVNDDPSVCDPDSGAWPMREQRCKVYRADE